MRRLTEADGLTDALVLAIDYARNRRTFGKIIGEHQGISFKLAEMATKVVAAHQMMVMAARRKAAGGQFYRDAPMPLIGEGTAEIQKMIIGQRLVRGYEIKLLSGPVLARHPSRAHPKKDRSKRKSTT